MHLEWLSIPDLNLAALNIGDVRDIRTVHCVVSCQAAELQKISMVIFVLFRNLLYRSVSEVCILHISFKSLQMELINFVLF
jgi:hypothetical protein